mmetsp:Transcript_1698/g.3744  ORF Transcript_1698/g.3744 Transcript_1698/m.3744 type:complete len:201 (-) Transcript_1698:362-964(-)
MNLYGGTVPRVRYDTARARLLLLLWVVFLVVAGYPVFEKRVSCFTTIIAPILAIFRLEFELSCGLFFFSFSFGFKLGFRLELRFHALTQVSRFFINVVIARGGRQRRFEHFLCLFNHRALTLELYDAKFASFRFTCARTNALARDARCPAFRTRHRSARLVGVPHPIQLFALLPTTAPLHAIFHHLNRHIDLHAAVARRH